MTEQMQEIIYKDCSQKVLFPSFCNSHQVIIPENIRMHLTVVTFNTLLAQDSFFPDRLQRQPRELLLQYSSQIFKHHPYLSQYFRFISNVYEGMRKQDRALKPVAMGNKDTWSSSYI